MAKNQKGITLIALIITIIVMLILVGVTVATAMNGGLFGTANKATVDTKLAMDKEELQAAVAGAYDAVTGMLNRDILEQSLQGRFTEDENGNYVSESGNIFAVNDNGEIEEKGITNQESDKDLKSTAVGEKYILNNVEYVVALKNDTTVELISSTPLGSVTLGAGDDSVSGETDLEIALNSYNNALNKIQLECERVVGYESLPKETVKVRAARSYISSDAKPYNIPLFIDSYSKTIDLELVENFVDTSKSNAWLACYVDWHTPMSEYDIGIDTVNDLGSLSGVTDGGLLLTKDGVYPMYSSNDGKLNIDEPLSNTFSGSYTRTYGVIPILTISMQ